MKQCFGWTRNVVAIGLAATLTLGVCGSAAAHCDTLDGPVVQDARKALAASDVTPVLKWVQQKDEKAVRSAFASALAAKGKKNAEAAEHRFFAALVKIHRAGEGAPFAGLKPAGAVEPVVAEADKALASGSPDALVHMVTEAVATGIKSRYERAAATAHHKEESVAAGREFVAAYIEFTHYVERLQQDAEGPAEHHAAPAAHGQGH